MQGIEGNGPIRQAAQGQFMNNRQPVTKQGMMYNTMYGGTQNQSNAQQSKPGNPIHIKIEDQTGITAMNQKLGVIAGTQPTSTTKKNFQQTT